MTSKHDEPKCELRMQEGNVMEMIGRVLVVLL